MSSPGYESSASVSAGRGGADMPQEEPASPGGRWPFWWPGVTLVIGLLLTAALALVSAAQFHSNEKRLLKLRVRDAGSVFTAALPQIQTSLASAAELATATNGNIQKFRRYVTPLVGTGANHPYVSVSLWPLSRLSRGPVTVVGVAPGLTGPAAAGFLGSAARSAGLDVMGLLQQPAPRLGFAYASPGPGGGFVVYAVVALPAHHRSVAQSNSAFTGLDYALYLGATTRPKNLLLTNVSHLPLQGRRASDTVPFGDTSLTLAMSARDPLSGSLPQRLPWIIAIVGTLVTVVFSALVDRLARRRRDAERLAGENRRLYSEQRGIAQTLQHALLPDGLPEIPGMQVSARYEAGEHGVDVGGDWYDVIPLERNRVMVVVGDVSGRGLPAATTMAALRYAIRGYAAQNDPPASILTKLSDLLNVSADRQLATVLCAVLDVDRREITVTSAGHLPPLLIYDGRGDYVPIEVGLPVGVEADAPYTPATVAAPAGSTFLAFTDGLVERRDDYSIDQGLARLREAAVGQDVELPVLLGRLVSGSHTDAAPDDIAILGLRWAS